MSHTAILIIGNNLDAKKILRKDFDKSNSYNLLKCNYNFVKPIQESGQPCGHAAGGQIRLLLETPGNGNTFFSDWMLATTDHKDGAIAFELTHNERKNIFFTRAYCIYLREVFDADSDEQMLTEVVLSAEKFSFGSGKCYYNVIWDDDENGTQPTAAYTSSEDVEKNTQKLYWIDADTYEEVEANTGCQKLRLCFETEGYAQDEQVTATITKDDGSTFADNSTELIFTGIVDENGKAISKEIYEADKT
jgi:hypothetical protein